MVSSATKSLNLCSNKYLLAALGLFTLIFLGYLSTNKNISTTTGGSVVASFTNRSTKVEPIQCELSLKESDGWFCENDVEWKRRKTIHHIQDKRNRISNSRSLFFQNNWEPTIQCEFERRLGNTGDGGKWVCDVHRFEQMQTTDLLVYSFGSNGEFSFESAIKEQLSQADIHTFDMGTYKCPEKICTFHQARLGHGKNDGSKSLQTIMSELGHQNRTIHIFKVDIEGSEFDLFEELFKLSPNNQTTAPYIRQILFEIHLGSDKSEAPCERTHRLFELFRANNYAIYHKEANLYDAVNVFEYALLRLNPAFFIRPT